MRRLVIYRRPNTHEYMDETQRYGDYDPYDQQYYDDRYEAYDRHRRPYDDDRYDDYDDKRRYRTPADSYGFGHKRNASFVLPNEEVADMIMTASAFGEYIAKHGYHFTPALADKATLMLVNSNNREHRWTSDQIRQQLSMHGFNNLGSCTLGDITFLANMAYADFYPEVLNSEHACIKYAMAVAKDPDGYDGIVFSRWIADLIGKKVTSIDWERYV